jgi:hypothetical protein
MNRRWSGDGTMKRSIARCVSLNSLAAFGFGFDSHIRIAAWAGRRRCKRMAPAMAIAGKSDHVSTAS